METPMDRVALPSLADHVTSDSFHHLLHDLRHKHNSQCQLDEALCLAANSGRPQMVQLLLDFGADPNTKDVSGIPLLTGVILSNQYNIAKCLIDAGCNKDNDDDEHEDGPPKCVPLHIALWSRHFDIAKYLIASGANLTKRDAEGNTALLIACIIGDPDMLMLCAFGVDYNVQNFNGDSCLHLAIQNDNIDIFNKLLSLGIDLNIVNDNFETPLLLSARLHKTECLLLLMEQPEVNIGFKNVDGSNVLMLASAYADVSLAEAIMSAHIDIKDKDNYNNNILNLAAQLKNEKLLLHLIGMFCDEEINNKGFMGRTILHWAVINQMITAIEVISHKICDIDVQDDDGNTPLILACKGDRSPLEIVEYLLNKHAQLNFGDAQGWTALHWAAHLGHGDIVDALMSWNVDCCVKTLNLETPLMLAVKQNDMKIIQKFACSNYWASLIMDMDSAGCSVLLCAVKTGHQETVEFLLINGCDSLVDTPDNCFTYCITAAADKGFWNIVSLLLSQGASVNIIDRDHKSLLYHTITNGDTEMVSTLLKLGANPDVGHKQTSCLICACKTGNLKLANILIKYNATVDHKDHYERTAFIWAAQSGSVPLLKVTYSNGANPKTEDISGDTALTVAAFAGHFEAVEFLLDKSDINHAECEEGMGALQLALTNGHNKCASLLLNAGADVNTFGLSGNSVLVTAVAMENCDRENLNMILARSSLMAKRAVCEQGRTVIHWAVADNNILDLLLQVDEAFDVDEIDENGASPLLLAIAHGKTQSAKILLKHHCKLDMIHADGRQPIHHAAVYGEVEILNMLLDMGVDPDSPAKDHRTPIILASIDGHSECVDVLIKAGVNVNQVYFDAITPLSAAVSGHHHETMQVLLQQGAYPDLIGSKKVRPLLVAILNDDMEATKMLIQWGANIEDCPDINNHPLSVAALKQRWAIMSFILDYLCNTNIVRRIIKAGAIYYFILDNDIRDYLQCFAKKIPSLQKLCRATVRQHLEEPANLTVQTLNLPSKLKEYMLLKK